MFTKEDHVNVLRGVYHYVDVSKYATEDELVQAVDSTKAIDVLTEEAEARLKKHIVGVLKVRTYNATVFFNVCLACFALGGIAHAIIF